ncbi:MutS family DNA mismatch repair protein [Faecalimonas canis]
MQVEFIVASIFALIVFGIVHMYVGGKKAKRVWREKFLKEWGKIPQREYDEEELEKISRYFEYQLKKGKIRKPHIDDITWNDLDMDNVFAYANNTKCSAGEEYLYYLLRIPVTEQKTLDERERLIHFFATHESERVELEVCFQQIGKTRRFSINDYIDLLVTLEKESNVEHYIALCTIPIGLILMTVFEVGVGFAVMLMLLVFDVVRYYKRKGEIQPYLTTFSHILKMLDVSKEISQLKINEVQTYVDNIASIRKKFKKFRFGSSLLMSTQRETGSLAEAFLDYIRVATHIDLLKFNSMLEEIKRNADTIDELVENIGTLDALISVASFRKSLPFYSLPELRETKEAFLDVKDVYHPLIVNPVANSIAENRNVLITGSNASGKSTFLKTVAINAILSQTIYTSISSFYRASFFQIYSSMALKDNLQGNESYYIVEIKSLKRILSHADEGIPMLCFVDEVLRGTNTVERISASAQILKSLSKKQVLCFAATHDIELTHMLENEYSNYHFQEEIQENDILFNYELYRGRAVSRNAIKLLSMIGYDKEIIENAEHTAMHFLKTGEWRV